MTGVKAENRKNVALEFLRLVGSGKPKEARHLFSPDCKQHNPFLRPGMDELLSSIEEVQKAAASGEMPVPSDALLDIGHVLVDGDLVAVHTSLGSPRLGKLGGLRQVHLFRFSDDKIVEYWDVTQQLPEKSPNTDSV
jgi:predicted SnoaL-like aldol condensation-catalyzing enzyme